MEISSCIKKKTNYCKLDKLWHAKNESNDVNLTGNFYFLKFFLIVLDEFLFVCKSRQSFVILYAVSSKEMSLLKKILSVFWETLIKFNIELSIDDEERNRYNATESCFPAIKRAYNDPDN